MKALPIWEQTLVLDPRNATWLKYGAGTYVMLRQFPAALKTYDRALDITPNGRLNEIRKKLGFENA